MLLVVLEVDHVGCPQLARHLLGRLADDLSWRPGADHRVGRVDGPLAELPLEPVVVDALEVRVADGPDPVGRPDAAERHLHAPRGQLLAEVERLDDAVHVELAEVEEEYSHAAMPEATARAPCAAGA